MIDLFNENDLRKTILILGLIVAVFTIYSNYLTIKVNRKTLNAIEKENQLLTNHLSIRQNLLNRFLTYDLNNHSWLAALTFGYRGLLQPSDWQLVQKRLRSQSRRWCR